MTPTQKIDEHAYKLARDNDTFFRNAVIMVGERIDQIAAELDITPEEVRRWFDDVMKELGSWESV